MSVCFEDLGHALAALKKVPGNTAATIPAGIANYTQYRLNFDDGDTELTVGSWIVGATSGAVAKIVAVNADSESWTNNTGYLYVDSWNGIAFQDNEEIKQAGTATAANVDGILRPRTGPYEFKGQPAKAAQIFVLAQTVLFCFDGSTPDQTAIIGLPIIANEKYLVRGEGNVRRIKFLDYASGSAGTVFIVFFY
jgi:hypothetical protein